MGESLKSYFDTGALHAKLRAMGFRGIDDLGPLRMRERYFPERDAPPTDQGGHVVHASTRDSAFGTRWGRLLTPFSRFPFPLMCC